MSGFARDRARARCDGVSLEEAGRASSGRRSTSTAATAIEEAYRAYETAFAPVPHRICYAVKANGAGAILRLLAGARARAPTSSPASSCGPRCAPGFPAERIVFSGVGKTDAEIALGLERGHRRVQRGERGGDRAHRRRWRPRAGAGRARHAARQPRHRPALAPLHLDRPAREQVRRGHRRRPGHPAPRARAARDRDRGRAVPHRLADHATWSRWRAGGAGAGRALAGGCSTRAIALRTIDIGGGLGVDYDGTAARPTRPTSRRRCCPRVRGPGPDAPARARPLAGGARGRRCSPASST